jgi:hypothetical protein
MSLLAASKIGSANSEQDFLKLTLQQIFAFTALDGLLVVE